MLSCGWASQQCVTKGKLNFWVIENILPSLTDKLDCLISYSQQILPFTHQLIIQSSATGQRIKWTVEIIVHSLMDLEAKQAQ